MYSNALDRAYSEFLNSKREALLSDKNYLENQFANIEEEYNMFNNASGLYELLEPSYSNTREVVYTYWKELVSLTKGGYYNSSAINAVRFYSNNEVATKVLPMFFSLQDLYNQDISEEFKRNPSQMLFKQFWHVSSEKDELQLNFYAGLMNSDVSKVLGVMSISCNEQLLNQFLNIDQTDTATYLYWDGKLVYSIHDTAATNRYLKEQEESLFDGEAPTTTAFLDESKNFLQSRIHLEKQQLDIIQISPHSVDSFLGGNPLPSILFMWILIVLVSSCLLFLWVFQPLRNVSLLTRHMRNTTAPNILPYPGKITHDELGDLILAYNAMIHRTQEMTQTLHKNEVLLKNAQIETLQAQLNPHFFYGTLESIRMIAEAHNETLISEIAYSFGNLMRYSLSREYFVSIQQEIDTVEQYVDIQKKRLGNRFTLEWKIDISNRDWVCPKFVLFSMIENAIVHDVSKTRNHVHIVAEIKQEEDDLCIAVTNDGPGIAPQRLQQLQDLMVHPEKRIHMSSQNNGRSIFNIHDRLQLYYGNQYEFSIQSEPHVKTVCSVRFHFKPQHAEELLLSERNEEFDGFTRG